MGGLGGQKWFAGGIYLIIYFYHFYVFTATGAIYIYTHNTDARGARWTEGSIGRVGGLVLPRCRRTVAAAPLYPL